MRQGGYRPHNHNSGVYWIRANAGGGGKRKQQPNKDPDDLDGDGYVDLWEQKMKKVKAWIFWGGIVLFTLGILVVAIHAAITEG
jgi:hypothetical protein